MTEPQADPSTVPPSDAELGKIAPLEKGTKLVFHEDTGTMEIEFSKPYEFAGQEYRTCTFRNPQGKDMRTIPPGSLSPDQMLNFAGRMTGLPAGVIDVLQGQDVGALLQAVEVFLGGIRPAVQIGRRSSQP